MPMRIKLHAAILPLQEENASSPAAASSFTAFLNSELQTVKVTLLSRLNQMHTKKLLPE